MSHELLDQVPDRFQSNQVDAGMEQLLTGLCELRLKNRENGCPQIVQTELLLHPLGDGHHQGHSAKSHRTYRGQDETFSSFRFLKWQNRQGSAMQKIRRNFTLLILTGSACLAQDVVRYDFQPQVIPETMSRAVVFEAQAPGSFTGIAFELDGADSPFRDDGVSLHRVANDGIFSISFEAAKITGKLTSERVFRPFLGFQKLFDGANVIFRLNVFAEIWSNDIPIVQIDTLVAEVLAAPNVVNMLGTLPLGGFDARPWAQKFYT